MPSAHVSSYTVHVGRLGALGPDRLIVLSHTVLADGATATTPETRSEIYFADRFGAHENGFHTVGSPTSVRAHLPADAHLTVASSMPVRDLEWFGGPAARAHANRGANGIDGVLSTALGLAMSGRSTVVLVGDIAFAHDSNALVGLAARGVDLRVVVVDNGGGGIFSFLPQATKLGPARFEQLFGTPHGTDIEALASAHGVAARTVSTMGELSDAVRTAGPSVTRVATDRADNVRHHDLINAAVAAAQR